jgi:predicted RNA-binding protein YlxR (DUF448 family)
VQSMEIEDRATGKKPVRTCVGCQRRATEGELLVRVVLGPRGEDGKRAVAVDLAGSAFGRGAHVHARPDCIKKACSGGLARSFKCAVLASPAEVARQVVAGCDRRLEGLLLGARRAGLLSFGEEAKDAAAVAPLVVVASDAGSIVRKGPVVEAIASGRGVAWRNKAGLGALFARDEVAIVAVREDGVAREAQRVRAMADAVGALAKA